MKKLIVMAAVVALAAASQAATWSWSVSTAATKAYDSSTDVVGSTSAYLFFGYGSSSDATAAKTAVVNALFAGTAVDAIAGYTDVAALGATGKTASGQNVSITGSASDLGKRYGFVVLTETAADGGKWAYISATKNGTGADTGATALMYSLNGETLYAMDGDNLNSNTSGTGWHQFAAASSDVPEPTSGLLVLLGVAGLALRRRRA